MLLLLLLSGYVGVGGHHMLLDFLAGQAGDGYCMYVCMYVWAETLGHTCVPYVSIYVYICSVGCVDGTEDEEQDMYVWTDAHFPWDVPQRRASPPPPPPLPKGELSNGGCHRPGLEVAAAASAERHSFGARSAGFGVTAAPKGCRIPSVAR